MNKDNWKTKKYFLENWDNSKIALNSNPTYCSDSYCRICGTNGRLILFVEKEEMYKHWLICEKCCAELFAKKVNQKTINFETGDQNEH